MIAIVVPIVVALIAIVVLVVVLMVIRKRKRAIQEKKVNDYGYKKAAVRYVKQNGRYMYIRTSTRGIG